MPSLVAEESLPAPTVRASEVFDGSGQFRRGAEADRLNKFMGGRVAVEEETIELGVPGSAGTELWHITFINLPAVPGQSVELLINKKSVYRNDGINNRVNGTFTVPTAGWSQTNSFTLKIPVVQFVLNRNYKIEEGRFVRFQADDVGGMKVRRQANAF